MKIEDLPKHNFKTQTFTYAGVGSRKTPIEIQKLMNKLAEFLEKKGYSLQSGDALGADKAFEGSPQPWEKDGDKVLQWSDYTHKVKNKSIFKANDATDECREVAKQIHPNENISGYVLDLHARNLLQVFGGNLDRPIDFLICWTPLNKNDEVVTSHEKRDSSTGGTGQAISYASLRDIPVINMQDTEWRTQLTSILKRFKEA